MFCGDCPAPPLHPHPSPSPINGEGRPPLPLFPGHPLALREGTVAVYDYGMQRMDERSEGRPRRSRGATRREVEPVLLPGGVSEEEAEEEALNWWRLFVAVELPKRAVRVLDGMARSMRAVSYGGMQRRRPSRGAVAYDAVRWTTPENMHITLKFLGDVHRDDVRHLRDEMDEVAAGLVEVAAGAGCEWLFSGRADTAGCYGRGWTVICAGCRVWRVGWRVRW